MGTSSQDMWSFGSMKKFMEGYNWENETAKVTLLDYAVINRTQVYAALERVLKTPEQERSVHAITINFTFNSKEFSWKDVSEESGPYMTSCPERILNLLTPTDSEYANKWRAACREKIACRGFKMKEGLVLRRKGSDDVYVLKHKYGKQSWLCYKADNPSRDYSISKRWITEHNYMPEEMLFDKLL
jgi:hypothetical protein